MAILGLAIVGSAGIGLMRTAPPPLSVAQVAAAVAPSVVTVDAKVFRGSPAETLGFFYGKPGFVLTNARVMTRATDVTVTDSSGVVSTAFLVGIDRTLDVAVLTTTQFKFKPLMPATGSIAQGSDVVAVGARSALRATDSGTGGKVIGTGRQVTVGKNTYYNLIQTDIGATADGNGGPLVDRTGQVVGMVMGDSGRAFARPLGSFDSPVRFWEATQSLVHLGPPLVAGDPKTLMLSSVLSGYSMSTSETQNDGRGWRGEWRRPPDDTYGEGVVTIYVLVDSSADAAYRDYESQISFSEGKGFTVASAPNQLGDGETLLQHSVGDQLTYEVVWWDRNFKGDVFISSGIPPAGEITMQTAVSIAVQQEVPVAANLASYK